MAATSYHFTSHWRVRSTVTEVYEILSEPLDLVRWWPEVYLAVDEIRPGAESGVGKIVRLHTKGWLPYTLRWQFEVVRAEKPAGFTLEASGDFNGTGVWTFTQDGEWVNIIYDWNIRAGKPLLRYFSWLLKPAFSANHRWAMARGEESLKREIARRNC